MVNPYISVGINVSTGCVPDTLILRRGLSADGPWQYINTIPLIEGWGWFYDTTAPIGVNVWYQSTRVGCDVADGIDGPFSIPAEGIVWLKDPIRPWADLDIHFCETPMTHEACADPDPEIIWVGQGELDREADATLLPVAGSEVHADVFSRRKDHAGSFQFMTRTLAAKQRVYELITYGGPLFLQLPPVYGQRDICVQPTSIREVHLAADQRRPFRMWTATYETVREPVGPKQGTACANWCAVAETFPTFADMIAVGGTWLDVANGTVVCPTGAALGYGEGFYGGGPYGD